MLGFDLFREIIDVLVFGKVIKDVVKHAADVVLRIVDDLFRLFVPKHRDGNAFVVIGIGRFIGFAQEMEAVDGIGRFKRRARWDFAARVAKRPAILVTDRVDNGHADRFLESF